MSDRNIEQLHSLSAEGQKLLEKRDDAFMAHRAFKSWQHAVTIWLDRNLRDSDCSEQWSALPVSQLLSGGKLHETDKDWKRFEESVRERLQWLETLDNKPSAQS